MLGGDDFHREAGYTALSRARSSTHLYITTATLYEDRPELHRTAAPGDITERILERWMRVSRAEHLGIDLGRDFGR